MRKNILEIISSTEINLKREYSRIFDLFYRIPFNNGFNEATLADHVSGNFCRLNKKLTRRCLSLEDFDESFGYRFVEQPQELTIDYLVSFSEYVTNLVYALMNLGDFGFDHNGLFTVIEHIRSCMEDVGYQLVGNDFIIIYVEKNPSAISVAEIVNDDLSYSVLEYNHFRLKGDLAAKKSILKNMADDIEPERKVLNGINNSFSSDLFQLLNKFIRHNSTDNEFISQMSAAELESVYDEIYQMWLLAKMELEYAKRKKCISELIHYIN